MLPLAAGDLCPRCRRIVPEEGKSRPISAPLTEPIDRRALHLLGNRPLQSKGLPADVQDVLRREFGADDDMLLRTSHRIQHWQAHQAHEIYRREGMA